MLRNSLSKFTSKPIEFKPWMGIILPVWVAAGFMLAQVIGGLLISLLQQLGVSFKDINESTLQTVFAAVVYLISLSIVIGVPWLIRKYRTTRADLGLTQPMAWIDFLLAPTGFFVYIILSYILTTIFSNFSFYNADQVQNTGFSQLGQGYEYVLAFLTLVIIAPVAEETLFRGYLLGKLRKYIPLWASILVTSILFGVIHGEWNVGVDVFALSIVLCLLRVWTGRLWPSILLHMLKNGIAFYFLFINPLL